MHEFSVLQKDKNGFQHQLLINAVQKYYRMLQREHSAILSTFIKLPFVTKIFVLSVSVWPLKTGFTVISTVFVEKAPYIRVGLCDIFQTRYTFHGRCSRVLGIIGAVSEEIHGIRKLNKIFYKF